VIRFTRLLKNHLWSAAGSAAGGRPLPSCTFRAILHTRSATSLSRFRSVDL